MNFAAIRPVCQHLRLIEVLKFGFHFDLLLYLLEAEILNAALLLKIAHHTYSSGSNPF